MPGRDGTGPKGEGSMSGKGNGGCRKNSSAQNGTETDNSNNDYGAGKSEKPFGGGKGNCAGGGKGNSGGRGCRQA